MKYTLILAPLALLSFACDDAEAPPGASAGGASGYGGSMQAGAAGAAGKNAGGAGSAGKNAAGSAGAGPAGSGGSAGSGGAAGASAGQGGAGCDGQGVEGIEVASSADPKLYPPYAADGCALLYLAPAPGGVELRRRDLATGSEETLAGPDESPGRPSMAGALEAWEASQDGARVVRVRVNGEIKTLAGDFVQATEPRAAAGAVVFTAWKAAPPAGDTDVMLFHADSGQLSVVGGGPGQQRFADVSATHIAFSDFSEDPDGTFDDNQKDLADLVIVDRAAGTSDRRAIDGKQAFPLLGSAGSVVFLSWPKEHPEPKLEAYQLFTADIAPGATPRLLGNVTQFNAIVRPSAQAGFATWVSIDQGKLKLLRAPLAQAAPPDEITPPDAADLLAPTAAGAYTLIAASLSGQPGAFKLRALP